MSTTLAEPVFSHRLRVPFADTDLAGIVHFSNFFRYMENAEHAFYRSLGFSVHPGGSAAPEPLESFPGIGWPRVSVSCDYKKPLRFEEEVDVQIRIQDIRAKTIHYEFQFWKQGETEPSATGRFTVICVKFDPETQRMTAVDIPPAIRARLEAATARA